MRGEKPSTVWVPRGIRGAWAGPALLAASLWFFAAPLTAQPLETGIQSADGRHFLLDDGAIRVLSKEFDDGPKLDDQAVSALYQGREGWGDSFLALTGKGLARVSTTGPALELKIVVPGEEIKVEAWGDSFLAYSEKSNEVTVVTPTTEDKLTVLGTLSALDIVSPEFAVVRTDKGFWKLQRESTSDIPRPESIPLTFPLDQAMTSAGGGRLILWSRKSTRFVDATNDKRLLLKVVENGDNADVVSKGGIPTLPEPPSLGLKVLDNGTIIAVGDKFLTEIPLEGETRQFPKPEGLTEALLADWRFLPGPTLRALSLKDASVQATSYGADAGPMADLGEGKVRELITPEEGRPLLFLETAKGEPKIDEDGKPVTDLSTNKPAELNVIGHKIYQLGDNGAWTLVSEQPREALVGPIQTVGDRVIYATQTEPVHEVGKELELDSEYPYPAVILHGRSLADVEDVWTYTKPRGETPHKGRIPESAWPVQGEPEQLLVTSESGTLLAIDAATGTLKWTSPELPMDDSSPLMLAWSDGLGLVAAKSTGRALLEIAPDTGALRDTVTLNDTFFWEKWRHLLGLLIVCAALAYYIYKAGKSTLYIRQIAGLKALDEAVGRATEMGKPVLYVVGLADVDDIQTMASLSILSHVARKTAEYDTPIITTTARAVVFSTAHEIVRDAFSIAGRPDAFSSESVRYISDDQFGYTAGVDGIMVREKPAANFYIGNFYAESLILAETGFATGAIQIAGTAQPSQVPFFVAACDYTLIGEELYAASAYLSRDPLQVGSLRGQDVGKMIVMILLVVCSILVSLGIDMKAVGDWLGVALV